MVPIFLGILRTFLIYKKEMTETTTYHTSSTIHKQILCPLCSSKETSLFHMSNEKKAVREFHHCINCDLMFVPSQFHLDNIAQKKRYLEHNNDPYDQDYRDFILRLLDHLKPYLNPKALGLDYGAGPGPALATMMREDGYDIQLYDPFFYPDKSALYKKYDFITCTETMEHMSEPICDLITLDQILKPSGWIGIMTGMLESWDDFHNWYYYRDPTHIRFYSKTTMRWIGERFSWQIVYPRQNVVLFQKRA